jgi:putative oxidoreductase
MIARTLEILRALPDRLRWLPPVLARVIVGVVFVRAGWGKVNDLDQVTSFFTSLGIPAPAFHATLVSVVELVGGGLLIAGLATRFAAVPLAITMIVATLTAQLPHATSAIDVLATVEVAYLIVFVWIAIAGAGPISIDHVLAKRFRLVQRSAA